MCRNYRDMSDFYIYFVKKIIIIINKLRINLLAELELLFLFNLILYNNIYATQLL